MGLSKKEIYVKIARKEISVEEGMRLLKGEIEDNDSLFTEENKSRVEETLNKKIETYIINKIKFYIGNESSVIPIKKNFMELGVESTSLIKISKEIENEICIELYPTLFFEYQNIIELVDYFSDNYLEEFNIYFNKTKKEITSQNKKSKDVTKIKKVKIEQVKEISNIENLNYNNEIDNSIDNDIAIIGMAGRFAQSKNLEELWAHLESGKDLITEIPKDHWDSSKWFAADRKMENKTYSKWGSFINDVDKFDSQFFGISPKEAIWMDPQLRLLLEVVYETMEDAGCLQYIRESNTGVFLGVGYHQYWDEIVRAGIPFVDYQHSSSITSNLSGRISYTFDLQGACIPIDNACASSLSALHLACQLLRTGELKMAFVAGSTILVSPLQYVYLSRMQALSPTGHCYTFDKKADGYVPGEAVVSILLKPLKNAIRDNDNIHAIIKGSAINHVGRSNNPTSPRPELQTSVIVNAWKNAGINPETLSYIEAHGTGTILGDPIEIKALHKAFSQYTQKNNFCYIGSTKAHIGHTEAAAGLTSVIKVILSMKKEKIPVMPLFEELNPYIKLNDSPFKINNKLINWKKNIKTPRRAGISSFGLMGNNAHVIIEEYISERYKSGEYTRNMTGKVTHVKKIFLLSAKSKIILHNYVHKFLNYLKNTDDKIENILYSLQTGRDFFTHRLAILCKNKKDLYNKLLLFSENKIHDDILFGSIKLDKDDSSLGLSIQNTDREIAEMWISGEKISWDTIYAGNPFRKISLPTYPFEKLRYWFKDLIKNDELNKNNKTEDSKMKTGSNTVLAPLVYIPDIEKVEYDKYSEIPLSGTILVFDNNAAYYTKIKDRIDSESTCFLIRSGKEYKKIESFSYEINPLIPGDFDKLFSEIQDNNKPYTILFCWSLQTSHNIEPVQHEFLFDASMKTLFNLCKSFIAHRRNIRCTLFLFIDSHINNSWLYFKALSGFSRSLNEENPFFLIKNIEIDDTSVDSVVNCAGKEFTINDNAFEIVYKKNKRYTRIVTEYNSEKLDDKKEPPLFRENGVYLIIGGAGKLGYLFAKHISDKLQGKVKLILVGRSKEDSSIKTKVEHFGNMHVNAEYIPCDISEYRETKKLIDSIILTYGKINGIIHTAGITRDNFFINKTMDDMIEVMKPKVHGTMNLDYVTKDITLDFFILFSSIASVIRNAGQTDYASANRFLDMFSVYRENLRESNKRHGSTLVINWPYWAEGGMRIPEENLKYQNETMGFYPLSSTIGFSLWDKILHSHQQQSIVVYGDRQKIRNYFNTLFENTTIEQDVICIDENNFLPKTIEFLQKLIAEITGYPVENIEPEQDLEEYGFDSMIVMNFNSKIEKYLIKVPKTLLYEYKNIYQLAEYFIHQHPKELISVFKLQDNKNVYKVNSKKRYEVNQINQIKRDINEATTDIAIIGLSGRYPQSKNIDEYWENLKTGKDCITEIPEDRWDWREFYDPDPEKSKEGKIYCKWGGFIADADKFDPLFFNISPREAELIDPQERLVLQHVWWAMEDAGYTREQLSKEFNSTYKSDVGVFIGITTFTYKLLAAEQWETGKLIFPQSLSWSVANRVSYFFNFHGPSIPVDTACSSSLSAIHYACESIKRGESDVAIAGGVNLYLHPSKYIELCQMKMLSKTGKCHTFGAEADGFVPGEGVGIILLKPLDKAIADHDNIYAVIKGTAINHDGKTNGYTVPNPNAQADVIEKALSAGNVKPVTISYIEAHGTGTSLGDPIEILGLTKAFNKFTDKKHYCSIGSAKSNIGHLEAAAGIAGVTKILLQMKYKQLVPSLHSDVLNSKIDFKNSPFLIQKKLQDWNQSAIDTNNNCDSEPRRAGVSSFGAGGINAHVILEEAPRIERADAPIRKNTFIIPFSAKTKKLLKKYIDNFRIYLLHNKNINLENLAYSLQVGREHFNERIAFFVNSIEELIKLLESYINDTLAIDGFVSGTLKRGNRSKANHNEIEKFYSVHDVKGLGELWIKGIKIDWIKLYESEPYRISLPGYPFEKKNIWISVHEEKNTGKESVQYLHPLITSNISTLKEQKFKTILSHKDFFITQFIASSQSILPGIACIEMARAASELAIEDTIKGFSNIEWSRPVNVENSNVVYTNLYPAGEITFRIYSRNDNIVQHCSGTILLKNEDDVNDSVKMDINGIKNRCNEQIEPVDCYKAFAELGVNYGKVFQGIKELRFNENEVLSLIEIPGIITSSLKDFVLHPVLMDAAIQSCIGFYFKHNILNCVPGSPLSLKYMEIQKPIVNPCFVYITVTDGFNFNPDKELNRFNILILDNDGTILVKIQDIGLSSYSMNQYKRMQPDTIQGAINKLIGNVLNEKLSPAEAAAAMEEIYE